MPEKPIVSPVDGEIPILVACGVTLAEARAATIAKVAVYDKEHETRAR